MQVQAKERTTPDVIEGIYVRGASGLVQLANVVKVSEAVGPKELNHFNRKRSATISANLIPFVSLGKALDDLDAIAQQNFPSNIKREYAGQSLEFKDSSSGLYYFFLLSLCCWCPSSIRFSPASLPSKPRRPKRWRNAGRQIARVESEATKDFLACVRQRKNLIPWPDLGTATSLWQ